ncbi:UNVERIFIED_CONTAM: hypothetical protein ACS92_03005 [Bacillus cereus]
MQAKDEIAEQHHGGVAEQQHHAIAFPGHLLGRIDAENAIGATFDNVVDGAREHVRHPLAEDHDQSSHDREDDYKLCDVFSHDERPLKSDPGR